MKKLLSIMLTVMMLASIFAIPASAFVPVRTETHTQGIEYLQDFSGNCSGSTLFTDGTPVDGKMTLDANSSGCTVDNCVKLTTYQDQSFTFPYTSYTVEFDVSSSIDLSNRGTGAYLITWSSLKSIGTAGNYLVYIPLNVSADEVLTFKLEIDEDNFSSADSNNGVTAQYSKDGGSTWINLGWRGGSYDNGNPYFDGYEMWYRTEGTSGYHPLDNNARFALGGFRAGTLANLPVLTFDNIKVYVPAKSYFTNLDSTGLTYTLDCESTVAEFSNNHISKVEKNEIDGNTYWSLKPDGTDSLYAYLDGRNSTSSFAGIMAPNTTFTFDLCSMTEGGIPFSIITASPYAGDYNKGEQFALAIPSSGDQTWYTYKVEIGNYVDNDSFKTGAEDGTAIWKLYRKARGASDDSYVQLTRGTDRDSGDTYKNVGDYYDYIFDQKKFTWFSPNELIIGYVPFAFAVNDNPTQNEHLYWSTDDVNNTEFYFDNLQFRNNVAYSGSYSKTGAQLYVESNEDKETVILASYEGDVLKDVKFADLTGGDSNVANLTVNAGSSATKLFIWNNLVGGKPILENYIEITQ